MVQWYPARGYIDKLQGYYFGTEFIVTKVPRSLVMGGSTPSADGVAHCLMKDCCMVVFDTCWNDFVKHRMG